MFWYYLKKIISTNKNNSLDKPNLLGYSIHDNMVYITNII